MQGFLKGAGLASLDQAEKRDTGKGEFWFAVIEKKGGPTAEVLPAIIDAAMMALPWPKSMRWGSGTDALGAAAAVDPGAVRRRGAEGRDLARWRDGADRLRRHDARPSLPGSGAITVTERRRLRRQAQGRARDGRSGRAQEDHRRRRGQALRRGAGVAAAGRRRCWTRWPAWSNGRCRCSARSMTQFMDVPPEVLVTSMRAHQKYFALREPRTARWPTASSWSPTSSPSDGGADDRRRQRARAARAAVAMPSSSGTRTARRRWKAVCRS